MPRTRSASAVAAVVALFTLTACQALDEGSAVSSVAAPPTTPGSAVSSPPESSAVTDPKAPDLSTTAASTPAPSRPAAGTSTSVQQSAAVSQAPVADGAATSATSNGSGASAAALVPVLGVIDGDTIRVRVDGRSQKVRIIGIDTPESRKPGVAVMCFAKEATSRMQSLVQSRDVRLIADGTQSDTDRYGRLLRHVRTADGRDVALDLVSGGYAREATYAGGYSGQGQLRVAQRAAMAAGRGLWGACGGSFPTEQPLVAAAQATRAGANSHSSTASTAPKLAASASPTRQAAANTGGCTIKGNINNEGVKIYHVPGGRSYAKTKINKPGERMFCSEQEALAAGWRAARG
ncbi:thermonuclease family protein [Dermacoccaceae bacterium W4C1]